NDLVGVDIDHGQRRGDRGELGEGFHGGSWPLWHLFVRPFMPMCAQKSRGEPRGTRSPVVRCGEVSHVRAGPRVMSNRSMMEDLQLGRPAAECRVVVAM